MAHESQDGLGDEAFQRETIRASIRFVLAVVVLLGVRYVLVRIPGTEQSLAGGVITVATVLHGVLTVLIFGAILSYSSSIGNVLAQTMPELPEIERVCQLVGVLVVFVWAYQSFWWLPYFRTHPGQYNTLFLILGTGTVGWLGYIVYSNVDKISDILTERLVGSQHRIMADGVSEEQTETRGEES